MNAKRGSGLTADFAIIISILLLATNLFLGVMLMNNSQSAIKAMIQNRMLDVANTAADMLDGDILEDIQAKDIGTPGYQQAKEILGTFQRNIDLDYIYCIRDNGNKSFTFTIDPDPDAPGEFGEPIIYTDALFEASQGTPSMDDEPTTDRWGSFYSAYSPVFNSSGKVAGIVGVDFSSQWYDAQIAKQTRSIFISSILAVMAGLTIIITTTRKLRKKVKVMTEELGDLAKDVDELTQELNSTVEQEAVEGGQDDEMDRLGTRIHSIKEELQQYTHNIHTQANSMISALSSNYLGVYYINLDKDEGVCYLSNFHIAHEIGQGDSFLFSKTVVTYARDCVMEKYRDDFIKFLDPHAIRSKLEKEPIINFFYMANHGGKEQYESVRVANLSSGRDEDGTSAGKGRRVNEIGLGFNNVDDETRRTLLQNKALSDALSVAKEASKAKTAFLSNMSHEIRTPMNAIIGLNRIALSDPDISESTRGHLEKIGSSAEHLLSIINEILDMTRIEAGKMMLKQDAFSLPKLLEQISIMIDGQCRDKGLNWNWQLNGTVDDCYVGDDMKLKQVLINILGNSVKFTPKGGTVSLTVEKIRHYAGKSVFQFTMRDTGIGMSSDYIPKLFEPFSQEDFSTKTKYGSTGLGMSITKSIVDMMNGEIKVESEKNRGTTFTVTVTLDDCDRAITGGQEADAQDEEAPAENAASVDLNGRRVLVAEDVEVNAEIIKRILETNGVETDIAQNGRVAVEKFSASQEGNYDAILMDMRMPEMDGLEATRAIRALERDDAKAIPIIALTANAFDEDVQRSLQSGLNAHLSKPINPTLLFETLRGLLR